MVLAAGCFELSTVRFRFGSNNNVPRRHEDEFKVCLRGRTLYRRHWTSNQERHLLVIPSTMRSQILHAIHDAPEGGHIGRRATLRKIQERFWWPRMERSVQLYVASCEVCQKHKRRPGCQHGLLTPITLPDTIFSTIGIDHVGPLPTTAAGNRYIIVAVDHLSKFVEVAAVPYLAAGFVIKFLQDRFEWKHGLPTKIISD